MLLGIYNIHPYVLSSLGDLEETDFTVNLSLLL